MFEQTFVQEDAHDKKRYTVLVGLLTQIATLAALIILPLIYTQVLPQAHLRSVFAAPAPPPPALPKAPPTTQARPIAPTQILMDKLPHVYAPIRRDTEIATAAAPDLPANAPGSDSLLALAPPDGPQVKPPDPPQPPAAKQQPVTKRVHIPNIEQSQLIHRVQPAYPAMAKQIHLQGVVEFTAVISKNGTIENLQLIHGHPLLVAAAKEAILQWRYKPTLLSGEPVEVITNIFVNFTLTQ